MGRPRMSVVRKRARDRTSTWANAWTSSSYTHALRPLTAVAAGLPSRPITSVMTLRQGLMRTSVSARATGAAARPPPSSNSSTASAAAPSAAATHARTSPRRRRRGCSPSAPSVAAISCAHVEKRSAGSFASARRNTPSRAVGSSLLRALARGGSSSRCAHATSSRDVAPERRLAGQALVEHAARARTRPRGRRPARRRSAPARRRRACRREWPSPRGASARRAAASGRSR